jgi:hypothetical protein
MTDINKIYRDEGWGKITDLSLGIPPENVESQARMVARWAHDRISQLEKGIKSVVSDVESMRVIPDDSHEDSGHWFGSFSDNESDDQGHASVEWPNLSISVTEMKVTLKLLKEMK